MTRVDKVSRHTRTGLMAMSALMVALMAVFSQFSIPMPLVPINLALLAVLLCGFVLPPRNALVAVLVYLLMGAIGLPVFSGLRGGPQALFGNTGGYLLGYFFTVTLVAHRADWANTYIKRFFLSMLAVLACYIPGTLWLMALTGRSLSHVLPLAVLPFLPGDALKCLLAALLAGRLRGLVR